MIRNLRRSLPQGGYRQRPQSIAERERLPARVQNKSGNQLVTNPPLKTANTFEVFGAHSFGGLYLDRNYLTGCPFQHRVYLILISIPIVVQPDRLLRPTQLSGELTEHKVFDQGPDRGSYVVRSL